MVGSKGDLRLVDFKNREFCSSDPQTARDLESLLQEEGAARALNEIRQHPERFSVNDAEQVVFLWDQQEYSVAMRNVPADLIPVLERLSKGFSGRFGRHYNNLRLHW
jgi:hypothetical protein